MTLPQPLATPPNQASPADGSPEPRIVCAITTESDAAKAERLARVLVERGLAGCVSLLPVNSIYTWQGRLERSDEVQLLIKTTPTCLEALHRAVLDLHSYDTPMWVHWPARADAGYGAWLAQVTAHPSAPPPAGADSPETGGPTG